MSQQLPKSIPLFPDNQNSKNLELVSETLKPNCIGAYGQILPLCSESSDALPSNQWPDDTILYQALVEVALVDDREITRSLVTGDAVLLRGTLIHEIADEDAVFLCGLARCSDRDMLHLLVEDTLNLVFLTKKSIRHIPFSITNSLSFDAPMNHNSESVKRLKVLLMTASDI